MSRRPRLLFVGDQCGPTGFSTVAHAILGELVKAWDVAAIGIGYKGDPHPYPWRIYPAQPRNQGDMHGVHRLEEVCEAEKPDVVLINSDLYVVAEYLHRAKVLEAEQRLRRPKFVAYSPIDTPGPKRRIVAALADLDLFVSYTDFGLGEMRSGGHEGKAAVIPHGIDTATFSPKDKAESRKLIVPGVGPGTLLIGNVNRNQPRKRMDLAVMYFAEWVKRGGDGALYLHCAQKDAGWDLQELAYQLGVGDRVFMPPVRTLEDLPDASILPFVYSALDIQVSTTVGEGWGLTTMEGMACRVPQIVPKWSALGEWASESARMVKCSALQVLDGYWTFGFGGVTDKEDCITALDELAKSPALRDDYAQRGFDLVRRPEFQWASVAQRFNEELIGVLAEGRERVRSLSVVEGGRTAAL